MKLSTIPLTAAQLQHHVATALGWIRAARVPACWQRQASWSILDLDFGSGEAFAACWFAWRTDSHRPQQLFYSALLPEPLDLWVLRAVLAEVGFDAAASEELWGQWPWWSPGVHQVSLEGGRVKLFLACGPSQEMLPRRVPQAQTVWIRQPMSAPAWSVTAIRQACGMVAQHGCVVWMEPMLAKTPVNTPAIGAVIAHAGLVAETCVDPLSQRVSAARFFRAERRYGPAPALTGAASPMRHALIIGAGLAGSAVAHALARRDWQVAQVGDGDGASCATSGQPVLAYHPSVTPDDAPLSRLSRHALLWARAAYDTGLIDWHGRIQLDTPERAAAAAVHQPAAWVRAVHAGEASDLAGVPLRRGGLWLPLAGSVDPVALCQAWQSHPGIVVHAGRIDRLVYLKDRWHAYDIHGTLRASAPLVILATGAQPAISLHGLNLTQPWDARFDATALQRRAGWSVTAQSVCSSFNLRCVVGAAQGGHAAPGPSGTLIVGPVSDLLWDRAHSGGQAQRAAQAAWTRWASCLMHPPAYPHLTLSPQGWRLSARDHLPLIGPLPPWPGLWLATGLGGRGLLWSVLAAEIIASELNAEPNPLPFKLRRSVRPERLLRS